MHPYLDSCAGLLEQDWEKLSSQIYPEIPEFPKALIERMFYGTQLDVEVVAEHKTQSIELM